MSRLSRKLTVILLVVLMSAVALNTFFLYRSVNRYDMLKLHEEAKSKANELADFLAGNLRELEMTYELESVIDLVDAKVIIFTNKRRVVYSNAGQVNVTTLMQDEDVLAARSVIENDAGDPIATVVVLEVRRSQQINSIFRLAMIGSIVLGLLLIILFFIILNMMVTKPLKKIMTAMEADVSIDMNSKDWQEVIYVHNQAHDRRIQEKERQDLFFQNASHELKSPLMNIQGYMEALEDGLYTQQEASKLVVAESQRIKNLVDQMIRSSKAESAVKTDLKPEKIDMVSFTNDLQMMVPNKLKFEYHGDQDSLLFDRTILQVILENLIQNACRYADTKISLTYTTQADGFTLTLRDDGAGIEPEVMHRLFERFVKGQKGRTGLGLAIVKQYITVSGGSIEAFNEGGAVFKMTWKRP